MAAETGPQHLVSELSSPESPESGLGRPQRLAAQEDRADDRESNRARGVTFQPAEGGQFSTGADKPEAYFRSRWVLDPRPSERPDHPKSHDCFSDCVTRCTSRRALLHSNERDYSVSVGPRSHYVRCLGWPRCRFTSHRRADTPKEAERKPCSRCEVRWVRSHGAQPRRWSVSRPPSMTTAQTCA